MQIIFSYKPQYSTKISCKKRKGFRNMLKKLKDRIDENDTKS